MCSRSTSWLKQPYGNQQEQPQESAASSPTFTPQRSHPPQHFDRGSQESFSSMPDPADPTTVTKTYKSGRKASAQANLASRSKSRRRRNKGQNRSGEGTKVNPADGGKSSLHWILKTVPPKRFAFLKAKKATAPAAFPTLPRRGHPCLDRRTRTRVCWTSSLKRNWTARPSRATSGTTSRLVRPAVRVFPATSPPTSTFFLSVDRVPDYIKVLSFQSNPTLHIYHDIYLFFFPRLFSHIRVSRSQPMLGEHPSSLTELHAPKRQVNFAAGHPGSLPRSIPRTCLS